MQSIENWDPYLTVLTDEDYETEYSDSVIRTGRSLHLGQLKLQIADMIFLINHWDQSISRDIHLVVAGAVTGEHFACITEMFPMISKIDLWDPKPPKELSLNKPGTDPKDPRIEFISDYLTEEKAASYEGRNNVFFISNLRTIGTFSCEKEFRKENNIPTVCLVPIKLARKIHKNAFYNPTEEQAELIMRHDCDSFVEMELTGHQLDSIKIDMFKVRLTKEQLDASRVYYEEKIWTNDHGLQKKLVLAMKPRSACLKFRLPYDWKHDKNDTREYFDGIIYKQAFVGAGSTETRLVPVLWKNGLWNPQYRQYSITQYERKMAYFNNEIRDNVSGGKKLWRNSVNGSIEVQDGGRLTNSFDTAYLLYVIDKYLYFMGYWETNSDIRLDSCMAVWNYIITRIEHYGRNGKPYNFGKMRRKQVILKQRKISYKSTELPSVLSGEELLEKQQKVMITESPSAIVAEKPLAIKEISFSGLDIDESELEEL